MNKPMIETISLLIIEDEPIWQKQLEISIKNLGFAHARSFTTAEDALSNLQEVQFDVALLDIRMNGNNAGIELGKLIHTVYHKPIIFITSGTDMHTVESAMKANPSAYLIKPVNEAALYAAIHAAIGNFTEKKIAVLEQQVKEPEDFFVKQGNKYKKIAWANVEALSVEGRYTKIFLHNTETTYIITNSLQRIINQVLPTPLRSQFLQANRNEFVHAVFVEEYNGTEVRTQKRSYELSSNYAKSWRSSLNIIS